MKASSGLVLALAFGALTLQGCADTGGTRMDTAQTVSTPAQTNTVQAGSAPAQATAPVATAPATAIPEDHGKPVVRADTADNFAAIVAAIHQQMQPGGRWQYIDRSDRGTIDASFADMQSLYDRFGSVDKMNQPARTRLLTDQSTVNAILTNKDGNRLICQSQIPVGSHIPIKTCRTYAQIQAQRRDAQEFFRKRAATIQTISGH